MSLVALTDEQYAHIREAWRIFDTDEDGLITPKDLQRLLLSFGFQHTVEELEVYLDNLPICVESDRCIDMPEFFLWTLKLAETIEQEHRAEIMAYEERLENFEGLNAYKKLVRKELLNTVRTNRMTLDEKETEVRRGDNRKVFDAVDIDGNGFLTYQDISFLSQEMGEKLTFQQLNTIMDTATDEGTMRRLTMERFEELCSRPVAWNELDMLRCHDELLKNQAKEREYEAKRKGAAVDQEDSDEDADPKKGKKKKGGAAKAKAEPEKESGRGCVVS